MKRKMGFLTIIASIAMLAAMAFGFTSCKNNTNEIDKETQESALIMNNAVKKMDSVSKMIFKAAEMNVENAAPLMRQSLARPSVRPMSKTVVHKDVVYMNALAEEVIEWQVYANYPYNIINYVLQETTNPQGHHVNKYKIGQTMYGAAAKIIDDKLNDIFENNSLKKPTFALQVEKDENSIYFNVDWDWRNEYLANALSKYNSIITASGKIEYDETSKEIAKIMMTWHFHYPHGEIMTALFDFKANEFYMIKGSLREEWEKRNEFESIVDVFNRGGLTSEKLTEYPYSVEVIKSNITTKISDIDFIGKKRIDYDVNDKGEPNEQAIEEKENFNALYAEAYEKLREIPLRDESDFMSLVGAKKADFLEDAVLYGLKKTEFISGIDGGDIRFIFLEEDTLHKILQQLAAAERIKKDAGILAFVNGANDCLSHRKGCFTGEFGKYQGKNYAFEYEIVGLQNSSDFHHIGETVEYTISDSSNTLIFEWNGENLINAKINGTLFIDEEGNADIYEELRFVLDEETQTYTVFGTDNTVAEIIIPKTYRNLPVATIGENAFRDYANLTSITIPESISRIDLWAFLGCGQLKNVYIRDLTVWWNMEQRGNPLHAKRGESNLFVNGEILTELIIPDGATSIDNRFSGCASIEKVVFPSGVTAIGGGAFEYCNGLTSVILPDSVTAVGDNAFANCENLISVTLPNGLQSIPDNAFRECTRLANVIIPDSVATIGFGAFYNCDGLTDFSIFKNVTTISHESFWGCDGFTKIVLTENVTHIEEDAFDQVNNVKDVEGPLGYVYNFRNATGTLTVNRGEKIHSGAFGGFLATKIILDDCVTEIEELAFSGCPNLTSIVLSPNISIVTEEHFDYPFVLCENCPNVKEFTSPTWMLRDLDDEFLNNVQSLIINNGEELFVNASNIKSLTISDTVKEMEGLTSCKFLTNVTISENNERYTTFEGNVYSKDKKTFVAYVKGKNENSFTIPIFVTTIGSGAFYGVENLTNIEIPAGVTTIGGDAFSDCVNLTNIEIPKGVTVIENGLFYGCSSLTSINIPDGVTSIGDYAFSYCDNLTSINIPDGVTCIGDYAFRGCAKLQAVELPENLMSFGEFVFEGCVNFTTTEWNNGQYIGTAKNPYMILSAIIDKSCQSQEIHADTKIIGYETFKGCRNLRSIIIPNSVTSIGDDAFSECHRLASVEIGNSVISIGENAFRGCMNLTSVIIGDGVTSIGENAFYGCGITSFTVGENNTVYQSIDGNVYTKDGKTLLYYAIGKTEATFIIPDGVERIADGALDGCNSLAEITIPDSVISIGAFAFNDCSGLTIYCEAKSKPNGWNEQWRTFTRYDYRSNFSVVWDYKNNDLADDGYIYTVIESVRYGIKNGEATVAVQPFVTGTVTIAASITYQGVEYNVTSIEDYAFYFQNLTRAKLPEGIVSIGSHAFERCFDLQGIKLPNSLTSIGCYAFNGCDSLEYITFSDDSTWYKTSNEANWKNKTDGTKVDVSSPTGNVLEERFIDKYYWYKL